MLIYLGLILATGAFPNIEQRHECLRHLLEPIGKNFDVLLLDTQRMNIHDTGVRERLIVLLDELTGVAQGISGQTFPFIYQLMRDRFHYLPNLMLLWRNYLDIQCAILKVFIEMATIQMTTSNAAEMARDFYEVCNLIMKTYLEQQKDRLEKTYSEDEEEPEDILMVIELFKKLTIQYIFEPGEQGTKAKLKINGNFVFYRTSDDNESRFAYFDVTDAKNVSDSTTLP